MSTLKTAVALELGNILAFTATLVVNGLASAAVIGGKTTAEISDQYPTLITPAGYVFSIWGIIYTLLAVFVVYQALPRQREKAFQTQISGLFILSSLFNIAWIFLWQYGYIALSVAPIVGLWATLAAIYLRLRIGKSDAPLKEKLCIHLPFSVYLAWITVATAADIAAAASYAGWIQWTSADAAWGIVAVAVLVAISLGVVLTRSDFAFGLVVIWALVGVAVKQSSEPNIVYMVEIGVAIVVAALAVVAILLMRKTRKQPQVAASEGFSGYTNMCLYTYFPRGKAWLNHKLTSNRPRHLKSGSPSAQP
ncbi:MAG: tryptophan-rich sensory protein [Candidatus Bathyarchaeota archaeon]|nr:tryptophan-rich sensory protein [Candidatus Bathyarchaeota archaeon]